MSTGKEIGVLRPIGIALVAVVCFGAGTVASGSGSHAATGPATIGISSKQTRYLRIDAGVRRSTTGDQEIIRLALYNRRVTTKPIGHAELVCTYTMGLSRLCQGTYFLPKGKLVVSGSILFRQVFELAVVGGTGLYDNARGTLTSTRTSKKPYREFLLFRLAG
jgi:hypothetical protein